MNEELHFREEHRHAGAPIGERMSALVDGELTQHEEEQVEQEVRESMPAQRELDRLRRLRDGVALLVDVDRPDHLLPNILAAAETESKRVSLRWTRRHAEDPHGRWALALGAGLSLHALLNLGAGWTALLALPLIWLATVGVDRRWRPRTVVLAGALGAAGPLMLELSLGGGALALPAAVIAIAMLQWRASSAVRMPAARRLLALTVVATMLARPDVVGAIALLVPLSGAIGGALAALDRPRRELPGM